MFPLNLTYSQPDVIDISDEITELVDAACIQQQKDDYSVRGSGVGKVAYNRIGAGYIGLPCLRQLGHKYHKSEKKPVGGVVSAGELARHAYSGHWTEDFVVAMLRKAGYNLLTHKEDGSQYGWMDCKDANGQYHAAGELDGIFAGYNGTFKNRMTEILDNGYPIFFESKKSTHKKWCKFSGISDKTGNPIKGGGVKDSDIKYYSQMQINMAMHNAMENVPYEERYTLFSMMNLDNMKFYFELVKFDIGVANRLTERMADVINSTCPEDLPRIQEQRNVKGICECRFCDYGHICYKD